MRMKFLFRVFIEFTVDFHKLPFLCLYSHYILIYTKEKQLEIFVTLKRGCIICF